MLNIPKFRLNDPQRAGQRASESLIFGDFSRYKLYAVHSRFNRVSWFVEDAEKPDDFGQPTVIRQEESPESAVEGLI